MKLTFKEYIESKKRLKDAGEEYQKVMEEYSMMKYCKIPLLEDCDSEEKIYIALKPKDKVSILWEKVSTELMIIKKIKIGEDEKAYYPSWSLPKMQSWIESSAVKFNKVF